MFIIIIMFVIIIITINIITITITSITISGIVCISCIIIADLRVGPALLLVGLRGRDQLRPARLIMITVL